MTYTSLKKSIVKLLSAHIGRSFVLLSLLCLDLKVNAQQGSSSQYMDNLTPLNQAYSLLDKGGSVNALVRKQYVGIQGAPTTFVFNGSLPVESLGGTMGLMLSNDQFAVETTTTLSAFFAKAIQLNTDDYLAVSLSAGIRKYVGSYSQLDANDPLFRNDVRETKPNLGFGILYYGEKYYIGISVPELTIRGLGTASTQNNNNFKNHYYLAAAYLADMGEDFKVKPAGLLSYTSGVPMIGDISGTFFIKETVGIGLNYRTNNKIAGIFSFNTNVFRLGYSYQFNANNGTPGTLNTATHEITLTYRFGTELTSKLL